jgi:hypothetical protein
MDCGDLRVAFANRFLYAFGQRLTGSRTTVTGPGQPDFNGIWRLDRNKEVIWR